MQPSVCRVGGCEGVCVDWVGVRVCFEWVGVRECALIGWV